MRTKLAIAVFAASTVAGMATFVARAQTPAANKVVVYKSPT